jgi:hypothetical protein
VGRRRPGAAGKVRALMALRLPGPPGGRQCARGGAAGSLAAGTTAAGCRHTRLAASATSAALTLNLNPARHGATAACRLASQERPGLWAADRGGQQAARDLQQGAPWLLRAMAAARRAALTHTHTHTLSGASRGRVPQRRGTNRTRSRTAHATHTNARAHAASRAPRHRMRTAAGGCRYPRAGWCQRSWV